MPLQVQRRCRVRGRLGFFLTLLALASAGCTAPASTMPPLPENPLPPCPGSPNCVRETRRFDLPPDVLFERADAVLEAMRALEVTRREPQHRLEAVFRAFIFKDDVQIAVAPDGDGALLHIRSASRVGHHDLGVNRRRVDRFFEKLSAASGPPAAE